MDYIITKIYELLIKIKLKSRNVYFEYSLLNVRGFTEYFIKPNTMNRVTIYYESKYYLGIKEYHKTFKNIKEAYKYFK